MDIFNYAERAGRDRITPDDVARAMRDGSHDEVRRDLLRVVTGNHGWPCDDPEECGRLADAEP